MTVTVTSQNLVNKVNKVTNKVNQVTNKVNKSLIKLIKSLIKLIKSRRNKNFASVVIYVVGSCGPPLPTGRGACGPPLPLD